MIGHGKVMLFHVVAWSAGYDFLSGEFIQRFGNRIGRLPKCFRRIPTLGRLTDHEDDLIHNVPLKRNRRRALGAPAVHIGLLTYSASGDSSPGSSGKPPAYCRRVSSS